MSADNLVYALPFKKMTGEVVWRVAQVWMSSLPWDLCYMMSDQSRRKSFQEFSGEEAAQQAYAAAIRMERNLPVCEYGLSLVEATHEPLTMAHLQEQAVEGGYDAQDVYALREASDDDFAHKEIEYWASH